MKRIHNLMYGEAYTSITTENSTIERNDWITTLHTARIIPNDTSLYWG